MEMQQLQLQAAMNTYRAPQMDQTGQAILPVPAIGVGVPAMGDGQSGGSHSPVAKLPERQGKTTGLDDDEQPPPAKKQRNEQKSSANDGYVESDADFNAKMDQFANLTLQYEEIADRLKKAKDSFVKKMYKRQLARLKGQIERLFPKQSGLLDEEDDED